MLGVTVLRSGFALSVARGSSLVPPGKATSSLLCLNGREFDLLVLCSPASQASQHKLGANPARTKDCCPPTTHGPTQPPAPCLEEFWYCLAWPGSPLSSEPLKVPGDKGGRGEGKQAGLSGQRLQRCRHCRWCFQLCPLLGTSRPSPRSSALPSSLGASTVPWPSTGCDKICRDVSQ